MAHFISTDSGHCYDFDDVQSGLRYIAEQRLGPVPSHILALVYNAIEHIERQKMLLRESMDGLIRATNSVEPDCIFCGCDATPDGKRHGPKCIVSRIRVCLPNDQDHRPAAGRSDA